MKFIFALWALSLVMNFFDVIALQVQVVNELGESSVCPGGNSVTLFFNGGQQTTIKAGGSTLVSGQFDSFPGMGIQINNWYWTSIALPVQGFNPQNPDNSGGQFTINSACQMNYGAAWYGKGIGTWLIANVSSRQSSSGCIITISKNGNTDTVTPGCCSPPGIGSGTCQYGTYGITNNGKPWPPQ